MRSRAIIAALILLPLAPMAAAVPGTYFVGIADTVSDCEPVAIYGGCARWAVSAGSAGIAEHGGRLYAMSVDANGYVGAVTARDAASGGFLWRYEQPLVDYGFRIAVSRDGSTVFPAWRAIFDIPITALDAATGAVRWQVNAEGWGDLTHVVADGARAYALARHGSEVPSDVEARDLMTGELLWRTSAGMSTGARDGSLTLSTDGSVLYQHGGFGVQAIDPTTGAVLWATSTPGLVSGFSLDDARDQLVLGGGPILLALDAATGAIKWSVPRNVFDGGLAGDTFVVIPGNNALRGYRVSDGALVWDWLPEGDAIDFFARCEDVVGTAGRAYLGCDHGIFALDAETGERLWMRYQSSESVVLRGDTLYTGGGSVLASVDVGLGVVSGAVSKA